MPVGMPNPYQNLWGLVKYGVRCKFGAFVDIGGGVEIGDDCTIQAHVSIPPGWKIGNNVFIGPGARFANDKYPKAKGEWRPLNGEVKDNASIGMGALIGPGITIEEGAIIGMGSVVLKDVEANTTVYGNPARKHE